MITLNINQKERIEAAYKLLSEESTARDKFESLRTLVKGIHPELDKKLATSSKALSDYKKLHQGEIVELSVENLPEATEQDKKRKKALLFLIRSFKDLKSELARIRSEFESNEKQKDSVDKNLTSASKIVVLAKGPFGLVTIAALAIITVSLVFKGRPNSKPADFVSPKVTPSGQIIKVIIFDDKKIALSELITGAGPECLSNNKQASHYHAINHTQAKALDGTLVFDPGGCGFGKVDEVEIVETQ